ncbi:MAG TPA: glycosyltransferase family 2 protein [Terriglobales bacterium]|jgi:dolichol-phosphate mannosyltransferase|nr:glycosyltransferase family 2 protein [Terriglobales bacterium]
MISIVVPAYNECGNMKPLADRAMQALEASGEPYELIIVDDNSPDGTAEAVRELQATRPWLRLIVRTKERGLSSAVITGWDAARGDVLGCMDADLQHPPEVLSELIHVLQSSRADVVVASRHVRGGGVSDWSLIRRFVSWTATLLATLAVPGTLAEVRDPMSGFFLLRRDVIRRASLKPRGYKILLEVLAKGDYRQAKEVPFVFQERVVGDSKIGSSVVWDYLVHLFRISLETGEAARAAKFISVGFSGAIVNLFVYRLLVAVPGWAVWDAAAGAAALAIVNNFVWNERFTFPKTRKASPGVGPMAQRLLAFALISSIGLILNVGVVEGLVGLLHFPWIPGVTAGIAVAGAWNFFANTNLTWKGERKGRTLAASEVSDAPASSHEPAVEQIK